MTLPNTPTDAQPGSQPDPGADPAPPSTTNATALAPPKKRPASPTHTGDGSRPQLPPLKKVNYILIAKSRARTLADTDGSAAISADSTSPSAADADESINRESDPAGVAAQEMGLDQAAHVPIALSTAAAADSDAMDIEHAESQASSVSDSGSAHAHDASDSDADDSDQDSGRDEDADHVATSPLMFADDSDSGEDESGESGEEEQGAGAGVIAHDWSRGVPVDWGIEEDKDALIERLLAEAKQEAGAGRVARGQGYGVYVDWEMSEDEDEEDEEPQSGHGVQVDRGLLDDSGDLDEEEQSAGRAITAGSGMEEARVRAVSPRKLDHENGEDAEVPSEVGKQCEDSDEDVVARQCEKKKKSEM